MKKENRRFLAFILAVIMAFSTFVYVGATDENEDPSAVTAEEVIETDETAPETAEVVDEAAPAEEIAPEEEAAPTEEDAPAALEEEAIPEEEIAPEETALQDDTNADLATEWSLQNLKKDTVIADTEDVKITALADTKADGTGSVDNFYYIDNATENKNLGSTRPYLKIEPKVNGNLTVYVTLDSGKAAYILEPTGVMGKTTVGIKNAAGESIPTEIDAEKANVKTKKDGTAANIKAFLDAGKTYIYAPVGTNPKHTTVSFIAGDTPEEEKDPEPVVPGQPDPTLEDIRTGATERTAPSEFDGSATHTIWVLGDSTGCYYGEDKGYTVKRNGFGMALGDDSANNYTAPYKLFGNNAIVRNIALSGRSSKSFLTEANYQTLINNWKSGDYMILAFGHNDEKNDKPENIEKLFTNASEGSNGWNIDGQFANSLYKNYILPAVKKGVTPILATPITRRSTSASGPTGKSLHNCGDIGDYRQTIIDLGKAFDIPVLDNTYYTYAEHIALGAGTYTPASGTEDKGTFTGYAAYHSVKTDNSIDNTHISAEGAKLVAYLMGQAMQGKLDDTDFGDGKTKPSITPVISDCTADDTRGSLKALSTFLGEDAATDPRGREYDDGSMKPDDFAIYFAYNDEDVKPANQIKPGDKFAMDCMVQNNKGISKVDITIKYSPTEILPDTESPITDASGTITIMSAADYKAAVEAGKADNSIHIVADLSNVPNPAAITAANATLFKIPLVLVSNGETTITPVEAKVYDADGQIYDDIKVFGGTENLDFDPNADPNPEQSGLKITMKISAPSESGEFDVDYELSGNDDEHGINNLTLAVNYDPAKVMAVGPADKEYAVGTEDRLLISKDIVEQQINTLKPIEGDPDYADAKVQPDGTKTAAELGKIRLAGYLENSAHETVNSYNNGIIFSIKFRLVDPAAADSLKDIITTSIPAAGAFGLADGSDITDKVEIEAISEEIVKGLKGDIDNNGRITSNDASILLTYVKNPNTNRDEWVINDWNANLVRDYDSEGKPIYDGQDVAQIMLKVLNSAYVYDVDKDPAKVTHY